jgi:hypothetical protein
MTSRFSELFQRCHFRVRAAAVMDDMRCGLKRGLAKGGPDFKRATPGSTGALNRRESKVDCALGWRRACVGLMLSRGAGAQLRRGSEDRMPWRPQIRMTRWVWTAVRASARPGRTGEIHSSRPA